MRDRMRDVTAVLDSLQGPHGWLGDRADVMRAGVFGHSRGSVTALAAAGGSTAWECGLSPCPTTWGFGPEPRVKAVMGLAIGALNVTFAVNLANITVPTLLVAGTLDAVGSQEVSEAAFEQISSEKKLFVAIEGAHHRSYSSANCNLTQSAGAIAQASTRAVLDLHMMTHLSTGGRTGNAGSSTDYCRYDTFVDPVDIRQITLDSVGFRRHPRQCPDDRAGYRRGPRAHGEDGGQVLRAHPRPSSLALAPFPRQLSQRWLIRHHSNRSRSDEYLRSRLRDGATRTSVDRTRAPSSRVVRSAQPARR